MTSPNESRKKIHCPHCGKPDTWQADNPYRPFCCERCKLIDLGAWANEDYRIQGNQSESADDTPADDDDTSSA